MNKPPKRPRKTGVVVASDGSTGHYRQRRTANRIEFWPAGARADAKPFMVVLTELGQKRKEAAQKKAEARRKDKRTRAEIASRDVRRHAAFAAMELLIQRHALSEVEAARRWSVDRGTAEDRTPQAVNRVRMAYRRWIAAKRDEAEASKLEEKRRMARERKRRQRERDRALQRQWSGT